MNLEALTNRLIIKTAKNGKHENKLEIISKATLKVGQQKTRMLPQQTQYTSSQNLVFKTYKMIN